jgi:glutamine amidotransferase
MERLCALGWPDALRAAVSGRGLPVIGICLGMQLLGEYGVEGGRTSGLGLVPGRVAALEPSDQIRIPHVGWNSVHQRTPCRLFAGIPDGTDFYFVHSYEFIPANEHDSVATTSYGASFSSAIVHQNVFGVQFHPEKSSRQGLQLIRNFLYGS